jgi:hypothetical protein
VICTDLNLVLACAVIAWRAEETCRHTLLVCVCSFGAILFGTRIGNKFTLISNRTRRVVIVIAISAPCGRCRVGSLDFPSGKSKSYRCALRRPTCTSRCSLSSTLTIISGSDGLAVNVATITVSSCRASHGCMSVVVARASSAAILAS